MESLDCPDARALHAPCAQTKTTDLPADFVIKNATVMTASHGTLERGSVWVHQGKIAGVGVTVSAPADATVIDATGKFLTPASSTRTPIRQRRYE